MKLYEVILTKYDENNVPMDSTVVGVKSNEALTIQEMEEELESEIENLEYEGILYMDEIGEEYFKDLCENEVAIFAI